MDMRYFLVFGVMFNKIVSARDENEVDGKIIRELTKEEVKQYVDDIGSIPNAD